MRIGPFPHRDIEPIKRILEEHGIPYSVFKDEEKLNEQMQVWKSDSVGVSRLRTQSLDPSFLVFEIPDDSPQKLKDSLKPFGVEFTLFITDVSATRDYVCMRCGFADSGPGLCPRHQQPLVPFEEYVEIKRRRVQTLIRVASAVILLIMLAAELYDFWRKYFR